MLSLKINELIELDPIARSEIVDDLKTNDATKVASAKTVKELQDNKFDKSDLNNTLTSTSTKQALTAAQGKILNDQAFGVGQDYIDVTSQRVNGTIYTVTELKPKSLYIVVNSSESASSDVLFVRKNSSSPWIGIGSRGSGTRTIYAVISPQYQYKYDSPTAFSKWVEA